jgi:Protein of unknown function (DUF3634)
MIPLIAVVAVVALWWLTRTRELFHVSIRDGKVLVVHGRLPGAMLHEIAVSMARPPVKRGTIRALKTETGGRLTFGGDIDEGRRQRMRNVFALYPSSQLRHAPAIERPTLGQLAGIAWLAWLFDRR